MAGRRTSSMRGTVDLLILKSLALEPLHGVGIFRRIGQITQDSIRVSYGSLFPALHRMEEKGWLSSKWDLSESNRRARYYTLTRTGRRQLEIEQREWARVVEGVSSALRSS